MVINGEEILLVISVNEYATGEIVYEKVCNDFKEVNDELDNPGYEFNYTDLITIDVCDINQVMYFSIPIDGIPLDEDEIEEYIDVMKESLRLSGKVLYGLERGTSHTVNFHPWDGILTRETISEISYVCPGCWNEIKKCECERLPDYLLKVDSNMKKILKTLNRKNYYTTACCEGHYEEGQKDYSVYISFIEKYPFSGKLPEPSLYSSTGSLYFNYNATNKKEFDFEKNKVLAFIEVWAESLPYN